MAISKGRLCRDTSEEELRMAAHSNGDEDAGNDSCGTSDCGQLAAILPWNPTIGAFQDYQEVVEASKRRHIRVGGRPRGALTVVVSRPIVSRLTKHIVETYQLCNPSFYYATELNPKRYLTNPSTGISNYGLDNSNSDLILAVNGVLQNTESARRYIVKEMLGQGTFGQVAKCLPDNDDSFVAVKVIKNQPAYYQQALVEINILTALNRTYDPDDKHHIVRILDHFLFQGHLCIAFELLSTNLYELIKVNQFKGIPLHILRLFTKQILVALSVLREAGVIHCDLKPENILLTTSLVEIKLIDFGSACMENRTVYSYIQSRFYRSPEVVLGHPYTTAIDMWSLGCVAAELFLGLPLFPGASEYDLLQRMVETLGSQPPDSLLRNASNTNKYFKHVSAAPRLDSSGISMYQFLTEEEYELREKKKPTIGKRYFKYTKLEDIILNYPMKSKVPEEINAERQERLSFIDFLRGLVQLDPSKRWTPQQAAQHPFIKNEPYMGPFEPPLEPSRQPVSPVMTIQHNPGSGHWFAAGLSPQVHQNPGFLYHSPQYAPHSYASSYGSFGSIGSCDGVGSYGSYNDMSSGYFTYSTPPSSNAGIQIQGSSALPHSWRRMPANAVPAGYGHIGLSPSSVFKPMSLGGSPSQFTPPGSQFQSSGSPQVSPGRYGPTSPARAGTGMGAAGAASALGKAAAVGQYNRRRGWGPPIPSSGGGLLSPHDLGQWQHFQHGGDAVDAPATANYVGSPRGAATQVLPPTQQWKQRAGGVAPPGSGKSSNFPSGSLGFMMSSSEPIQESVECTSPPPGPGDWDPDYSDDFLQDDPNDAPASTPTGVLPVVMGSGGARLGPGPGPGMFSGAGPGSQINTSYQASSAINLKGTRSSTSGYNADMSLHSTNRNSQKQPQYGPFSPQQTSPSRLGQQPMHVFHQRQQLQEQYLPDRGFFSSALVHDTGEQLSGMMSSPHGASVNATSLSRRPPAASTSTSIGMSGFVGQPCMGPTYHDSMALEPHASWLVSPGFLGQRGGPALHVPPQSYAKQEYRKI